MSVREGETFITHNYTLSSLAILATTDLPLNNVATIVGLQSGYDPGRVGRPTYVIASSIAIGLIAMEYALSRLYTWIREHWVELD